MTKISSHAIELPGFHESYCADILAGEVEQWAEYEATERQKEEGIPKPLWLSFDEYVELAWDRIDDGKFLESVARCYTDGFAHVVSERLAFNLDLTYLRMSSPRVCNFGTARIFANISGETIRRLFGMSAEGCHRSLKKKIEELHTSYDGFHSYYSRLLRAWLAKPVLEWDPTELRTLLEAVIERATPDGDDIELDVYHAMVDMDGLYEEFSAAMDWNGLRDAVDRRREEKRAKVLEEGGEVPVTGIRCPNTRDLFPR